MLIAALSDFHNYFFDLPKADVLIIAGDATMMGTPGELQQLSDWLSTQIEKYSYVIVIHGNHDKGFDSEYSALAKEFLTKIGVLYLNHEFIKVAGLKIFGSPFIPQIGKSKFWASEVPRGDQIAKKWKDIPENLDILITHGPPYGVLDKGICRENYGCYDLKHRIETMKLPPKIHIFGHVHSGAGNIKIGKTEYFNVSIMDEQYEPAYPVTMIEI